MKEGWKSAYRRAGNSRPAGPPPPTPYQQACREYLALRKRAQKSLLLLGGGGVVAFAIVCFGLGRLSLRLLPPPEAVSEAVVLVAPAPAPLEAEPPAELAALTAENIELQLEVHHRMETIERAYALAMDWSVRSRQSSRATRPPPPPELLRAVGLRGYDAPDPSGPETAGGEGEGP